MKKVVIIGGMAAGCKAAARLKRLEPETNVIIIEKRDFISYGSCGMPLYASGEVDGFLDLAKTPWGIVRDPDYFRDAKGVDVVINTEALRIDTENRTVHCRNIKTGNESEYNYDNLVIATGARALIPNLSIPESDRISTFHNPHDARRFRQKAQTGQVGSAVIIGGGFIGCELAEALVSLWGIETTLVEKEARLLPGCMDKEISMLLEKKMIENDINLKLSVLVGKIEPEEDGSPVVFLSDGSEIKTDYLFLCAGVRPETGLAVSAGIETGKTGGIIVNGKLETNIPGVYAAGDCIETNHFVTGEGAFVPLGSLANRQGRVVADNIAGKESVFRGTAATISMQVFELITASTGINEAQAKTFGYDHSCIWGCFYDRPDYHPEHKTLFAKMIYENTTMRLLGLQLAGRGEVTRYIDVFSDMLGRGAAAKDLIDLEHAYNPPHSGPMNPLNHLGAMAENMENDGIKCINPTEVDTFEGQILDVREKVETDAVDSPEGALKYTSAEYGNHIEELDKNKPLLVVCQKGPRSYEAAKLLKHSGFKDVCYLGGGLSFSRLILDEGE